MLGLRSVDVNGIPLHNGADSLPNQRYDWLEIDHSIASHMNDHKSEKEGGELILPLHRFIDGYENVEALLGKPQKLDVLDASPPGFGYC